MEDKNEKLLNTSNVANKGKTAKNESNFNFDSKKYAFHKFYRHFKKFKRMASLDSKHGELKKFYELLSTFKDLKPLND